LAATDRCNRSERPRKAAILVLGRAGLPLAKALTVSTSRTFRKAPAMQRLLADSHGAVFVEYLTVLSLSVLAVSAALMAFGVSKARSGSVQRELLLQRYP